VTVVLIYSNLTVNWFVDVVLTVAVVMEAVAVVKVETSCLPSYFVPIDYFVSIDDIVVPYMKSRDYKSHNV
tara:strand:- start:186 stop:398 length:213 start_codon:yes stop_codon:yes gene_type:complete